jgi:YidC/Oxa1 family membrane protein insertase
MSNRLFLMLLCSFSFVLLFNHFTRKNDYSSDKITATSSGDVQSGEFYSTPVKKTWAREPNREINFDAINYEQLDEKEETKVVETDLCSYEFSNIGGALKNIVFKEHKSKSGNGLQAVLSQGKNKKIDGGFFMAFEGKSPVFYKMSSASDEGGCFKIIYEADYDGWIIRKNYYVYDNSYRIDLKLEFENKKGSTILPRLIVPSAFISDFSDSEINGFVCKNGKQLEKIDKGVELGGVWGRPEIFGTEDKYFANTLVKDEKGFIKGGYYKRDGNVLISIFEGEEISKTSYYNTSFYIGPKLLSRLNLVDERLEDLLSFGWLSWLSKFFLRILELLFTYFNNFGLAIIVLTILLKIPFIPFSVFFKGKMEEYQKYQPILTKIRMKYRQDRQRQNEEIIKFHQDHNISPATPMLGVLPMLLQIPFFIALYRILANYISLYQAPFFFWIKDLSAKDPYYVLPILMGATMLWLQAYSSTQVDAKQKLLMMFVPIIMTAVFVNFPAGLVLYWLTNNILTLFEEHIKKAIS